MVEQAVLPLEPVATAPAEAPVSAPIATPAAEPVAEAAPAVAPAVTEQPTAKPATAPAATPAVASQSRDIAPAPMQLDALRDILSAAGLTLASTDPDKLRAAQEAAARIVPPVRVPRERKPLPPQSTEPLVQVETRR